MTDIDPILEMNPYSLVASEKNKFFLPALEGLIEHHFYSCEAYRKIFHLLGLKKTKLSQIEEAPFLPVRLFKWHDLLSVPHDHVVKTLTSSGTSGQSVSKIFLDQQTAALQSRVLAKIVSTFIGTKRSPLLILDSAQVLQNRALFSARGAAVLGFSIFGRDVTYALDEKMCLDFDRVQQFCKKYEGERIFIFGFTSLVWKALGQEIALKKNKLNLEQAVLIHGGGWKKLIDQAVGNETFKKTLLQNCGIKVIHNYYGMVEQTGSIFMECSSGYFHSSHFSDVLIRRNDFSLASNREKGIVEIVSLLPRSYPGHVLLSEDLGEIFGEDDCECGLKGKYFKIHGRLPQAEMRGCSDAHSAF